MSQEFGFASESFKSFPDLYPSPAKHTPSEMETSTPSDSSTSLLQALSIEDHEPPPPPANILIKISFTSSDPDGVSINDWTPMEYRVSERASEGEFSERLRNALLEKKSDEQVLINQLKQSQRELHFHPAITFGDWRDLYLTPDVCGTFNFERFKDLFFHDQGNAIIPITVDVAIRAENTEENTFLKPNRDRYLAVGYDIDIAADYSVKSGTALKRVCTMHLAQYNDNTRFLRAVKVDYWPFESGYHNDRYIGDVRSGATSRRFDKPDFRLPIVEHYEAASELKPAIQKYISDLPADPSREPEDNRIPDIPKLSFQRHVSPYKPPVAIEDVPLAVRFVDRLSLGRKLELPGGKWGSADEDTMPGIAHRELCTIPRQAGEKTQSLFSHDMEKKWALDLWIVPQSRDTAYFWWHGSLTQSMGEKNVCGRDYRLYTEAHIVPVGNDRTENAPPPRLQGNDPVSTAPATSGEDCNSDEPTSERENAGGKSDRPHPLLDAADGGDNEYTRVRPWTDPEFGLHGYIGTMKISFDLSIDNHTWPSFEHAIPLDSSLLGLAEFAKKGYKQVRQVELPLLRELHRHKETLIAEFEISEAGQSGRIDYINQDHWDQSRVERVRDLFPQISHLAKNPIIKIKARVHTVSDNVDQTSRPKYRYHRYGTLPLPGVEQTGIGRHVPMRVALLARYDPADPTAWIPVQVPFRKVNNALIGTSHGSEDEGHDGHPHVAFPPGMRPAKKYSVLPHRWEYYLSHEMKDEITRNIEQAVKDSAAENNVPKLPHLSFLPFEPNHYNVPAVEDIKNIYLAIRIENRLGEIGRENIPVPRNVLMNVTPGTGTFQAVQKEFMAKLEEFAMKHDGDKTSPNHPCQLYVDPTRNKWKVVYWVMPQDIVMQKLRLCNAGEVPLEEYLDKTMVLRGDMRLYMEAHLITH